MCFYVQQIADCEPPTPQNNNNNKWQQHLYYLFYYYYYWLFLYSAILCSSEDSLCSCHMWFWMSHCILFIACVSNIHRNSVLTVPFGCCMAGVMYISKLTRFISEVIPERALKICMMVTPFSITFTLILTALTCFQVHNEVRNIKLKEIPFGKF